MFDPQYLRDRDRWFLSQANWSRRFVLWPRRDFLTKKLMFATYSYRAVCYVREGDFLREVVRWYSEEFALWYFLTKEP